MGKIKIADLDKKIITDFLCSYDLKINREFIKNEMLVNLGILLITILFSNNRIVSEIMILGICIVVLGIYIYFIKAGNFSKGKICLYHGIYACIFTSSFGILGYYLIKKSLGNESVNLSWIFLYILICFIIAAYSSYQHVKKLYKNNFEMKKRDMSRIIVGAPVVGILISKMLQPIEIDIFLLFGAVIVLLGTTFSSLCYFFVLSYCYSLVEKNEGDKTIPKQRNMYTRSVKKK